jgi:hypothetical protein
MAKNILEVSVSPQLPSAAVHVPSGSPSSSMHAWMMQTAESLVAMPNSVIIATGTVSKFLRAHTLVVTWAIHLRSSKVICYVARAPELVQTTVVLHRTERVHCQHSENEDLQENASSLFECFRLCLSRACLGKMMALLAQDGIAKDMRNVFLPLTQ